MEQPGSGGWCEELYRAKASELLLYARAFGLSHSEAEDVLQETFIALLRLDREPDNPKGYAVRALRNRSLNYKRSLWRRFTRELESKQWFEPAEPAMAGEEVLLGCLRELPTEQREVIVLKVWHEYTFQEIADLLEVSTNTVAGRYRYGLQKMRNALKHKNYERAELFGESAAGMGTTPAVS